MNLELEYFQWKKWMLPEGCNQRLIYIFPLGNNLPIDFCIFLCRNKQKSHSFNQRLINKVWNHKQQTEQEWAYKQQIKILCHQKKNQVSLWKISIWSTDSSRFADLLQSCTSLMSSSYRQSGIWNQSSDLFLNRFCRLQWLKHWAWMLNSTFLKVLKEHSQLQKHNSKKKILEKEAKQK